MRLDMGDGICCPPPPCRHAAHRRPPPPTAWHSYRAAHQPLEHAANAAPCTQNRAKKRRRRQARDSRPLENCHTFGLKLLGVTLFFPVQFALIIGFM